MNQVCVLIIHNYVHSPMLNTVRYIGHILSQPTACFIAEISHIHERVLLIVLLVRMCLAYKYTSPFTAYAGHLNICLKGLFSHTHLMTMAENLKTLQRFIQIPLTINIVRTRNYFAFARQMHIDFC